MLDTIPAVLRRNAAEHADDPALVTEDESISHAELDGASAALAARLVAAGVSRSSRVGLLGPNGIAWATAALAVTRLGTVLVPLSTLLRGPELEAQLRTAGVTQVLAASAFRRRSYVDEVRAVAGAVPTLEAVWALEDGPGADADAAEAAALEAQVRPVDDLSILFTSGSTGAPKGVIHTHGAALGAVASGLPARGVCPGERLYVPMPFFWTGGFSTGLLSALVAGATLLTEAEPEPARTLAFLTRERVTVFRGWPDQAAALAAHPAFATTDLSSLSDFSLTALLPPDRRPAPGARPNMFGMTETFGPWCGDRLDRDLPDGKHGSCGRPLPGVEVRVGEDGGLELRGPNLLRAVVGREHHEVFTPDGWFATGDRGRVDGDGYVWFEGRLDDMFKVKGATVYPSEVEAALRGIAGVRQAHVTDVGGEVAAALVGDVDADDVRAEVRERLSHFKLPTRWLVTSDAEEIPMTATGKVDKTALRALLEART